MPNWQPNWQDVRWDFAAADRAASELERAADELDRTLATRNQFGQRATVDWFGAYRDKFDAQLSGTQRTSQYLAGSLRAAAARIRQASLQASDEQARRLRERDRWRREKAQEDARKQSVGSSKP